MKNNKPKIAMIMVELQAVGGAQLQILRIASILRSLGHEIMLIGQGKESDIRNHLLRFNINPDFSIYPVSPPPRGCLGRLTKYFPNTYFLFPCLIQLLKNRHRYDVVHGQLLMGTGLVCSLSTLFFRKPSIIKLGSAGRYGDVRRAVNNTASGLRKILFKHISKFVCLTREIEFELSSDLGIPNNKLIRIPNGIDLNIFHPVTRTQKEVKKRSLGIDVSKKLVLFVGRLEHKKRVDFLLKAWKIVQADKRVSANLLIVGDGSLRIKLEKFKNQLKVCDTVTFYGESENIAHLMQSADVFVLPSVSEGLANVFLEAMSSGLPIVATNTTGNAEILSHKVNALLFSEKNHRELADYILYLLKDDKTAQNIGLSARKTVAERFNVQKIAGQYSQLYQNLIQYYTAG